jgi:hypothetical protein
MADVGRISVVVRLADGRTRRWAGDEREAARVLQDLSFSTSAPGGFKDMSCGLLRDLLPGDDEQLFAHVWVLGGANQILWEGRMQAFPRTSGAARAVNPAAVGWGAHLADDVFTHVYVDRQPAWTDTPQPRKLVVWNNGFHYETTSGTGNLSMVHHLNGGSPQLTEAWYDAGAGSRIARIDYTYSALNTATSDAAWFLTLLASDGSDGLSNYSSADLHDQATSGTGTISFGPLTTAASGKRYVYWQWGYSGTAATAPTDRIVNLSRMALYGAGTLAPLQAIAGEPPGFFASDLIADMVGRFAPQLRYSTGPFGSIRPTTYPIPHAAFPGPTTVADAAATVNAYHGWDLLVYDGPDGPTVYYQPPGSGTVWEVRGDEGGELQLEGDTGENVHNGIIVTYNDGFTGEQRRAGPTGSTAVGLDVTNASLRDDSPNNPANVAGLWRPMQISLSFPTNDEGAVAVGALALSESNLATRAGSVTLTSTVQHPVLGERSVAEVRAGDAILYTDQPGATPRRIVETTYQHNGRQLSAQLNSSSGRVEALLERLLLGSTIAAQAPGG